MDLLVYAYIDVHLNMIPKRIFLC